ncbi:MAG: aminotransferase class I/II-fold pyridoxal phosphate-dependent enzyme [Caldisericaceae bacterium]
MEQDSAPLYEAVREYIKRDMVPFHMPGHSQGKGAPKLLKKLFGQEFFDFDLTEVSGLDYLHYAHGVIRQAEELAADLYGTKATFFLVNGTTAGIHAMILSTVKKGEKIIIGRNSHRSVIGGIIEAGAIPIFVQPEFNKEFGIITNITPESLASAIEENPDAKAVHITTPNYYGFQGRIKEMIDLVHRNNMYALVDEAHAAHFPFNKQFPKSAIKYGADIVAQSAHKTLPTLTQTSFLHVVSDKVNIDRVEQVLGLIESSSPSYIFMISMDIARREMALRGEELWDKAIGVAEYAREEISKIPGFRVTSSSLVNYDDINAFDPIKLTINVQELGYSGFEFESYLNDRNIEIELSDLQNVLLFITIGTRYKDVDSLLSVLKKVPAKKRKNSVRMPNFPPASRFAMTPNDAFSKQYENVRLKEAVGRISWGIVAPYPPGIPVFVPGMEITRDAADFIDEVYNKGGLVQGSLKEKNGIRIRVVKE